jgi:S-adenosylmethionine/arginine decarboxylase-like enzyme
MGQLGKQHLVGLRDCNPRIISAQHSKSNISGILRETSSIARANVVMEGCFESQDALLGVNVISESHIILYASKKDYDGKVHIFTCNQFRSETQNEKGAVQYAVKSLNAAPSEYYYIIRGIIQDKRQILFNHANLEERLDQNRGEHVIIEAYGCNPDILKTVGNINDALYDAIKAGGMATSKDFVMLKQFHSDEKHPHGVSGVVVYEQEGNLEFFTIHTWPEPEFRYAALDFSSNREDHLIERILHNLDSKKFYVPGLRNNQRLLNDVSVCRGPAKNNHEFAAAGYQQ